MLILEWETVYHAEFSCITVSHFSGCKILTCLDHISSGLQSGFSSLKITPGAHSIPNTDRSSYFYSHISVS